MPMIEVMEKLVSLCKRRGIVYPGSEIYGGLAGTWDYGPLGALIKKNIKDEWWKEMVQFREDVVGIDAAIMMSPKVWEASGHVEAFTDPLVECKVCHKRFRQDQFEEYRKALPESGSANIAPKKEYLDLLLCSNGKLHALEQLTEPRVFNLLVEAFLGVTEPRQKIFLRGEITQGVHVNFKNIIDSSRCRLPFGIAQIGKAFRNEITPGNFTFRSREFEQMELQYFVRPNEKESLECFEYWKNFWLNWYVGLGIRKDSLRLKDHEPEKRAHYARAATDLEYKSPWGWAEFMGIHHRGDWDLSRHQQFSGRSMVYRDTETNEEYVPWDIESSIGVDRSLLFFLIESYTEEEKRVVLKIHPKLASFKVAVFPLLANKPELVAKAREIYRHLKKAFVVDWDDRGNIGKRYLSQDEIGTPWCVTIDFQTLEDGTVTIRDRDTTEQIRERVDNLTGWFQNKLQ